MSYTPKNTNGQTTMANSGPVVIASDQSVIKVDLTSTTANSVAVKVDGSSVTQPISVSTLPLPTGAATSAKQPAPGTAGTASSDVLTVQGITSMTPIKTDGSATTQPISGSITANVGTTNGLALDATLTGGTQQTKLTDGTNVANVLKSDGTSAGQNAQLIAPAYKEVGSLSAGSLNADLVPSTDVSGYSTFVLQVLVTWVGTLTLQGSNDNLNFVSVYGTWIGNTQPVVTISTTGIITCLLYTSDAADE